MTQACHGAGQALSAQVQAQAQQETEFYKEGGDKT